MKKFLIIAGAAFLFSCNNQHAIKKQPSQSVLLSNINNKASCVYLTSDENNKPVISWCEQNASGRKFFFMRFFNEKKNSFDASISIPVEQNTIFMEEDIPKIAVKGDGTIIAVYETKAPTKQNGWAGFVHYIQSFDKGKTWTQPLCVHHDTASGKTHSYAAIARLSDGEIGACWLDESLGSEKQGRAVKFAKTNGGNGFQHEVLIDSFACQCCRTAISSDDKGNVSILFRDILPDSIRDIAISTSSDNGKTFSHATSFSNDNWVINGCPEDGPCVVNKNNSTYAVWFTGGNERGVHYAALNNNQNIIAKQYISNNARFIQLCLLPDNTPIFIYNETDHNGDSAYSNIVLGKMQSDKMFTENVTTNIQANYPVVQAINNDKVVAAWKKNGKVFYTIADVHFINTPVQTIIRQTASAKPDFASVHFALTKDTVCGMPLTAGIGDTVHYKGRIYGFCSKECKDEFMKNPRTYNTISKHD